MICAICREEAARAGLLCDACRIELVGAREVAAEQVAMFGRDPTSAALVDAWGRPHRLDRTTPIGRHVEGHGLAIFHGSVSRQHATIVRVHDRWTITDTASTNGTYVDGARIAGADVLGNGVHVRFGHVAFFFLETIVDLIGIRPPRASSPTLSIFDDTAARRSTKRMATPFFDESHVDGPAIMTFKLHEPVGGGGAMVEIGGKFVQFTLPQYELTCALVARMQVEMNQPSAERGFVSSSELLHLISWDTSDPNDDHLSQLVRRVRRGLIRAGIEDVIESRHGFGYRLRVLPRIK